MENLLDRREVCRFFGGTRPLNPATLSRGRFIQPASGRALLRNVEEKGNPYAEFMSEYFVEDPNGWVTCYGFYELFRDWCAANGYGRLLQSITGANQLIRKVNQIDRWSWLSSIQSSNRRVYPGIRKASH